MDLSVVLQFILNAAIVGIVAYFIISRVTGASNKVRDLYDNFRRWRQRYSKW